MQQLRFAHSVQNYSPYVRVVLFFCFGFCIHTFGMLHEQAERGCAAPSKLRLPANQHIEGLSAGRSLHISELFPEHPLSILDGELQNVDEERELAFNGSEILLSTNGESQQQCLNGEFEYVLPASLQPQTLTVTRQSRFSNFLPATARTIARILGAAHDTSNLWAPVLRLALYNRYGQTQAYKVGNVLLNTTNVVFDIKEGQYHSIPSSIIDSLYQLGYLSQVKKTIKRHTGLSMTDISRSLFYNAILFGLFLKASQSAIGKICFSFYEIPSLFTNGMNTQFFRPFDRLVSFQRGISTSLDYMQKKVQRFSRFLSRSQQIADAQESAQAMQLIAIA